MNIEEGWIPIRSERTLGVGCDVPNQFSFKPQLMRKYLKKKAYCNSLTATLNEILHIWNK